MISIIIPTYNEGAIIEQTLTHALSLQHETSMEIILTDGGSTDDTASIARRYARVVASAKGKALQLNAGARAANGDILFFVHSDMRLPEGALRLIQEHIYTRQFDGGGFCNAFSSHNAKVKILGRIFHLEFQNREEDPNNLTFFGDNGIFVRKDVFEALCGFSPLPIMEDFDFSKRMNERFRAVRILEPKLIVSPRRQLRAGFVKTHLQWLLIKRLFLMGVPAQFLAKFYPDVR